MFELDETQLNNLMKCTQCKLLIKDDPKVMPCGANICSECCDKQQNNLIECNFCGKNHYNNNFFPNNSLKQLCQLYEKQRSNFKQTTHESEPVKLNESTRIKIEKEYKKVEEEIASSVNSLMQEIDSLKKKLICELEKAKDENFMNFDEKFYLKLTSEDNNNHKIE